MTIGSLTSADTGKRVCYTSTGGDTCEEGVIVSYSADYVFVRYDKRIKPKVEPNVKITQPHAKTASDSPGVATDPANLEFC